MTINKLKIIFNKVKWLAFHKVTSLFDFVFYQFSFSAKENNSIKTESKKIIFVGEFLPPRIPRMAKWIKRQGNFETVLVCHHRGFVQKFSDASFNNTILFRNEWHLKRILKKITNIYIVHGFAPKSFYCNIARTATKAPYIHDMQDVYATYYGLNPALNWLKKELPHERECLEKADGVIAHCLEANVAYRKFKIEKKPPTLFFPLYCDDDFFQEKKSNFDTDNIHLVYAGGVAGSHRNPKQYGNIQFHQLIKTLTEQGLHFHIYPSPSNTRADYEEYEEIAKHNSMFHFHTSVSQQQLAVELSKYDFGIHLGFVNDSEHAQSSDKYKYCTTLKLFNFIEAGLPVIISDNLIYQSWILERYSAGVTINRKELLHLKNKLLEVDCEIRRKKLFDNRNKISLQKNIGRLISFYEQTIASK